MIKELKLSNFRLFGKEVTVRFRPITILIGKNNAGKSSIIKFLMMLKQSTTNTKGFLTTNGNEVSLGKFYELKTKNKRIPNLKFSLTVGESISPNHYVRDFLEKLELQNEKITYRVEATVGYSEKIQFGAGNQEISLWGEDDKYLLRGTSSISPNSTFLYSVDETIEREQMFPNEPREKLVSVEKLDSIAKACIEKLRHDIQSLDHLSAAREELAGFAHIDSPFLEKYVGKIGENTIFQIWKEKILNDDKKRKLLFKHTDKVLGIDDIVIKEWGNQLLICSAKNSLTNARTSISSFGFGVSQCLPIFVQGLLMPRGSQLIIEQPEAQVHPTAQIAMGSFFVDLWKERGVGSIIETHSENILLRIRKHIVKGDISENDVSVAYFEEGETPTISNLDIKEDGTIPGLPMEFFGANILEALDMGTLDSENE